MKKSDFEFWTESAEAWAEMIGSSGTFIKYDVKVRNYDAALDQIELMREKLARLSKSIKELKRITA